jgi:hypothetical protein
MTKTGEMNDTAYEDRLADALEKVMEQGASDLESLATALNALGVLSSEGAAWTAATLESEFKRLGEAARLWERTR